MMVLEARKLLQLVRPNRLDPRVHPSCGYDGARYRILVLREERYVLEADQSEKVYVLFDAC